MSNQIFPYCSWNSLFLSSLAWVQKKNKIFKAAFYAFEDQYVSP